MKLARWLRLTTLTALGLGLGLSSSWQTAIATTFTASEVDQNRFVLLATSGGSRLTVLEQISNARSCWQDNGNEVQVLLLNFDFTGICGRSTDLNGYSVRTGGEDQGAQYRLQVRTEGNLMVLYAVPRRGGTAIEVGRTQSIPQQFGRIYLNSGWRLTRRTFNGQTLGHLYLTHDQSMPTLIASAGGGAGSGTSVVSTRPSTGTSGTGTASTPGSGTSVVTQPTPSEQPSRRTRRTSRRTTTPQSEAQVPTTDTPITIPVPQPEAQPVRQPSTSSGPSLSGSPLPPPPSLSGTSGDVAVVPVPVPPPTPSGDRPPGDSMIPVVPVTRDIWFGEAPTYSTGTPQVASRRAADLGFSYRLIVNDSSADTQRRLRSIVPDAFRTVVDGQVVMQAGLFYSEGDASDLIQRLNQEDLQATLVPVN